MKILKFAVESAILLGIYWIFRPPKLRSDWHLVLGPALLVLAAYSDTRNIDFYFRMLDSAAMVISYFGFTSLLRMIQNRKIDLGWNLKTVLIAFTVVSAFQSLVFVSYTIGMLPSYSVLGVWMKGSGLAFWIILAIGMSEYSPPRKTAASRVLSENSGAAPDESTYSVGSKETESADRNLEGILACGKG